MKIRKSSIKVIISYGVVSATIYAILAVTSGRDLNYTIFVTLLGLFLGMGLGFLTLVLIKGLNNLEEPYKSYFKGKPWDIYELSIFMFWVMLFGISLGVLFDNGSSWGIYIGFLIGGHIGYFINKARRKRRKK